MATTSDSEFCFVHAADLHLDTPFRGVQQVSGAIAAQLREASLNAFDAIVALALERNAAFFLVAGDVYDGAVRGLRAQIRFREGLTRLADAGIPTFVVHGNHDPVVTGWSAVGSWPKAVTIFPSDHAPVVPVMREGRRIATVQGVSYATAETTENLSRHFSRPPGEGLHVGVLHCNVQGVADGYANYSPCTIADLKATGLDYLALGHIHQRRVLHGGIDEHPWIVYPGNSQARSPRRSEQEPKGAYVVHVENSKVTSLEFVACDQIRYVELHADIDGCADLGELSELLEERARHALSRAEGRSIVARARLSGRGTVHGDLLREDVVDQLLASLRERAPKQPFCWWDSIGDDTSPAIDLDEIRRRGDFAADLLGVADEVMSEGPVKKELLAQLRNDLPARLLEVFDAVVDDEERLAAILERGRHIALDLIEAGDA
jgi:DNA repair exonuclease SbcCD nuclease subunit